MRKYYLSVTITCDECGIESTLDNQTETEQELERHVERYYSKKDGKDLCEDCANALIALKKGQ